jgi:hypothetical protein
MSTKTVLVTWQHGSIDKNVVMMYMNPYTSQFLNETLLLETGSGYDIESIKAVYNEPTRQVMFMIEKVTESGSDAENWMILVEFDTMKIISKKKVGSISAFEYWEFFLI